MNKEYSRTQPYQLIIFDWEGTLGDTVWQTLYRIAIEAGRFSCCDDATSQEKAFQLHLMQATRGFFPSWSNQQIEQFCLRKTSAEGVEQSELFLFPGAKKLIESICAAGIHLAIASNKGQQSLQMAIKRAGLQSFFAVTRSAGQTPPKPCPQMLEEILAEFLLMPGEGLMIGDSVSDIEMAKQIGMDSVGFDYYYQNTAALNEAGALAVFHDYNQLAQFLNLENH